jgi:hypothetical protein
MSDKTSTLDKIIALLNRPINKNELKTLKDMVLLATECDEVRRYHLRLNFFVQVITTILSFTVIYLLGKLLIEYIYGGRLPYV